MCDGDGFVSITWADVQDGDTVYIDNYQGGEFPSANPRVSGPYRIVNTKERQLETIGWTLSNGYSLERKFFYYPNGLLRRKSQEIGG